MAVVKGQVLSLTYCDSCKAEFGRSPRPDCHALREHGLVILMATICATRFVQVVLVTSEKLRSNHTHLFLERQSHTNTGSVHAPARKSNFIGRWSLKGRFQSESMLSLAITFRVDGSIF